MALKLKIVPAPLFENLIPPNKSYEYFAGAAECPFQPPTKAFSVLNAWWLAEVSLLAYADAEFSQQQYLKLGLVVKSIAGSKTGTECFVIAGKDFIWVAFRGTQINPNENQSFTGIFKDIMTDVKIKLVQFSHGGHVHLGFHEALVDIWLDLEQELVRLQVENPNRTLWFTGHSLGGGLATLAADRWGDVQGLYIFGCPSAGNQAFADDFHVNAYRIINNNDVIARIPPFPYAHIGQLKYIDSDGVLHDNPKYWDMIADSVKGHLNTWVNYVGNLRASWNKRIPLDYFNDHAPIYYAIHLWNCYVKSR